MSASEHLDDAWPNGWEEHRIQQMRRLAALPLVEKVQWLEDAQELVEAILAARKKQGLEAKMEDANMSTPAEAQVKSWADLPLDVPMPLLERRRIIGQQAMISHVTLRRGCFVASHSHENEQFSCIVSGKLKFGFGTPGAADFQEVFAGPGDIVVMPSFAPHSAEAIEDTVVLDIFSPPSATTGIDRKDRGH